MELNSKKTTGQKVVHTKDFDETRRIELQKILHLRVTPRLQDAIFKDLLNVFDKHNVGATTAMYSLELLKLTIKNEVQHRAAAGLDVE